MIRPTFPELVAAVRTMQADDHGGAWVRAECWAMAGCLAATDPASAKGWHLLYVQVNAAAIAVYARDTSALCEGRIWEPTQAAPLGGR